jgi:hypothetical protein
MGDGKVGRVVGTTTYSVQRRTGDVLRFRLPSARCEEYHFYSSMAKVTVQRQPEGTLAD